jgi:hypothetical protein
MKRGGVVKYLSTFLLRLVFVLMAAFGISAANALTVDIYMVDDAIIDGDTSEVFFDFSESLLMGYYDYGFSESDISAQNGTLSNYVKISDTSYSATFTPWGRIADQTNTIAVNLSSIMTSSYTYGTGITYSPYYTVNTPNTPDTVPPALASAITMSDRTLGEGDTSTVTFVFTEAVTGFTTQDISAPYGTMSEPSSSDGVTWTSTFTPNANSPQVPGQITLTLSGVTDLERNAGSGTRVSESYSVNTIRPTVSITMSDYALTNSETATVTFTFNKNLIGINTSAITAQNGTLTNWQTINSATFSATFTPNLSVSDTTNLISVDMTQESDGTNYGLGTTNSPNYTVNTAA